MAWKKISFAKNPAPATGCFHSRQLWNGIPKVCFYFCFMEQNSDLFSLPRNGSERNSESLLLFCFMVQKLEHFSPLRNGLEQNSESFLFRGKPGILPEQTNSSIYSVFHLIICNKGERVWPWKYLLFRAPNGTLLTARCHFTGPRKSLDCQGPTPSNLPS